MTARPTPSHAQTLSSIAAKRIREVREARGWSQRVLAAKLSAVGYPLDNTALHRIERQQRNLSLDDLAAIAYALGCQPPDLISPDEPVKHPDSDSSGPPQAQPIRVVPTEVFPAGAVRAWFKGQWPLRGRSWEWDATPYDEDQAKEAAAAGETKATVEVVDEHGRRAGLETLSVPMRPLSDLDREIGAAK